MGKIDFGRYKDPSLLVDTIGSRVELKRNGKEWETLCPFHSENTPSFRVVPEKGYYYCFGCHARGDALDFVMDYEGVSNQAAREIIDGKSSDETNAVRKKYKALPQVDYYKDVNILPIPEDQHLIAGQRTPKLYNPKRADDPNKKFCTYTPDSVYEYRDVQGNILGYVLRVMFDDKKITPTIRWCELPDKTVGWCHMTFDEPRPLYMQEFLEGSEKPICIVEGEKAADAAEKLIGSHYDVVCWHGGTPAISKADFSLVKGRSVLLWGDMDEVGMKAMCGYKNKNGEYIKGVGDYCNEQGAASVKFIEMDEYKAKGWDAADALDEKWTWQSVQDWAKKFVKPYTIIEYDSEVPDYLNEEVPIEQYIDDHNSMYGKGESNDVPVIAGKEVEYQALMLWKKGLQSEGPEPKVTHNAIILMRYHAEMKGVLAYNENNQTIDIVDQTPWGDNNDRLPRQITDADYVNQKSWLEVNHMRLNIGDVRGAVLSVANTRIYNPLKSHINAMEWDGHSRLDSWLTEIMGVPDSAYSRLVGRKFMIGAIARGLKPGSKMDTMLILEGKQGAQKSTAIKTLFTEKFFTDELHNIGSKDCAMQIQGKWGVEIAELGAMNRADINQMKEFSTRTIDKYRPPYGITTVEVPRTCVFLGTVNPEGGYLKDSTGARRFLPIRCGNIDIRSLKHEREQIWAEAKHCFLESESWWSTPDQLAIIEDEQAERYEGDSWGDNIDEYLIGLTETTVPLILDVCLSIPKSQWTAQAQQRIGKHLGFRGWGRKRVMRGGTKQYVYFREELLL